ncbi:hypothetical protein L596_001852 [Steinernema carpocapsae]|uniref:Uncharacterized protein n=1 Tax=Steinernema carpocapsae TaxID=34508 RepID=A0A4U8URB4_STECR|nr:hypothetical protein L596_001852 [Steinernema carpocapsae]
MVWVEKQFVAFTKCHTYGLHIVPPKKKSPDSGSPQPTNEDVVFCINHSGFLMFPNGDGSSCHLSDLLEPSFVEGLHTLDLVCADTAPNRLGNHEAFIATCWVGYDKKLDPKTYIAAILILDSDFSIRLGCNFKIDEAPSYCRLTMPSPVTNNMHSWLMFSSEKKVDGYLINAADGNAELIEDMFDVYPGLDLGALSGAATRTACTHTPKFRWSAVGFDTGRVNVTISDSNNGSIIDRKGVKYNGVISFLHFLNKGLPDNETYMLVSSTSGPPVMWHLVFNVGNEPI